MRAIAELWKFGVAPEEIIGRLPHLTLAQVFDALSYYQEYREAIDEDFRLNRVPAERFILASSDRVFTFYSLSPNTP